MRSVDKKICLTEKEFMLVMASYNIPRFMCFETSGDLTPTAEDTFSLYKKGYIENGIENLEFSAEICEIFSALKASRRSVVIENNDIEAPNYYLSFSDYPFTVLMEPGTRKGEYIKIRSIMNEDLVAELEGCGIIRKDNVTPGLPISIDDDTPVLFESAKLKVIDSVSGAEIGFLNVVQKGVGERIQVICGNDENYYQYSGEKLIEEILKMVNA